MNPCVVFWFQIFTYSKISRYYIVKTNPRLKKNLCITRPFEEMKNLQSCVKMVLRRCYILQDCTLYSFIYLPYLYDTRILLEGCSISRFQNEKKNKTYFLIFVWHTIRLVVKNNHQNIMCYNEFGLCAQNMNTILGSLVSTIERRHLIFYIYIYI